MRICEKCNKPANVTRVVDDGEKKIVVYLCDKHAENYDREARKFLDGQW